jgi:multidrug resistance efflux pump
MKRKIILLILAAAGIAAACWALLHRAQAVVLTGIVTTDQVIVSPVIQGRLEKLLVAEGDAVTNGQLLAMIQPQEWVADMTFFERSQEQLAAQVSGAEADVKYLQAQTSNQIWQASANYDAATALVKQAEADLEIAGLNLKRDQDLFKQGVISAQMFDQTRTAYDAVKARVESQRNQAQSALAAVGLARASQEQIAVRRAALAAATRQLAAASAQKEKAQVRLNYTEVRAPVDGVVDVRAALQGEVVGAAQPIVTLVNPDNFWVRADVEEGFIEQVRLGDKL